MSKALQPEMTNKGTAFLRQEFIQDDPYAGNLLVLKNSHKGSPISIYAIKLGKHLYIELLFLQTTTTTANQLLPCFFCIVLQ